MANQYVVTRESLVKALTTGELELEEAIKGGPGSGFHGHVGRAGERGGSAPKGTPATRKRPEHLAEKEISREAQTLFEQIHEAGGFTYEPVDDTSPTSGFSVSIFPDREKSFKSADMTVGDIEKYLWDNADVWDDKNNKLGGWHDTDTGIVYLDVSVVTDDRETAWDLSRKHGQEGFYDLAAGETIIVKAEKERRREVAKTSSLYRTRPARPREEDVAIVKAAWMSVKGFDGPILDKRTRTLQTPEELVSIKTIGPNRIASYLCLWGHKSRKDISGEFFTPNTQELLSVFKAIGKVPLLYHHAMDDTMKTLVVGTVESMEVDEVGLWVEAQVREHQAFKRFIEPLISQKSLGLSSGTLPGARKVDRMTGEIKRWPIVEASMTPTPAEWRMLSKWPVDNIKAAYRRAGLEFDVLDHAISEVEKDEQLHAELERERELLALLSL